MLQNRVFCNRFYGREAAFTYKTDIMNAYRESVPLTQVGKFRFYIRFQLPCNLMTKFRLLTANFMYFDLTGTFDEHSFFTIMFSFFSS